MLRVSECAPGGKWLRPRDCDSRHRCHPAQVLNCVDLLSQSICLWPAEPKTYVERAAAYIRLHTTGEGAELHLLKARPGRHGRAPSGGTSGSRNRVLRGAPATRADR